MPNNEMNMNSGVCSHSSPTIWQDFIIFEIDTELDHELLVESCRRRKFDLVELRGSWMGVENPSYILPALQFLQGADDESIGAVFCWEQDCVLHISAPEKRARAWRDATLLYTKGKFERIGKFKQVRKADAMKHDSWTHNPNNGGWWICEDNEKEYL